MLFLCSGTEVFIRSHNNNHCVQPEIQATLNSNQIWERLIKGTVCDISNLDKAHTCDHSLFLLSVLQLQRAAGLELTSTTQVPRPVMNTIELSPS